MLAGASWNQKKYKRQPVQIENWDEKWSAALRAAWRDVKVALRNPNILAAPRHGAEKRLEMDAGDASIRGLLLQIIADGDRSEPLGFTARKLLLPELKFFITKKKRLATVHEFRTWRHYVQSEDLEFSTDNHSPVCLIGHALMRRRLSR